ncbi:Cytohesin-1 [Orchesella cincta]|uniref:Cytohesin-1 n=1 Tax=Orchesella cincta TaxID=48709 RepID=A0A1D2NHP8_ORCCI|nr:Cytohesin-1 [Orchesella cincta]
MHTYANFQSDLVGLLSDKYSEYTRVNRDSSDSDSDYEPELIPLVLTQPTSRGELLDIENYLTPSERALLDQIRARKSELLKEIAQLQNEIDSVSRELLFKDDPPDLLNHRVDAPPLADVELDNLSEHSDDVGNKIPSSSLLGSNSSSSSCKEKDRLKIMSLGCKKFNMDPKKGIEFLLLNSLLKKEDEQDIALFLYRGEGLNKTAIGDYLGEKSDFNEKVLKAFVALHDFTDLILVQALRQFLWSFRLPGEAQKIDRMMETFAQRYCQNNPDIFTNTDTCYVLSFAIIMLNTSLHNPSVKEKPTVDTFISMNRGINNGGDLPRELLISLYNSIQSEPFKIPEDDGNDLMHTFFNPDKEGWLWKQGGRYKTWKRRWFILNDNCLYYFEFTTDKEPRGIIPERADIDDAKSKQKYCFELYATDGSEVIKACKTDSDGRVVEGKHSVYRMSAASSEERDSWVKALKQSISYSPFYEILRKSGAAGNSTSSLRAGFGGKT